VLALAATYRASCSGLTGWKLQQTPAEKLAHLMLTRNGLAAIWDIHVAAAVAYGLGKSELAEELVEIAGAAEREWDAKPRGGSALLRHHVCQVAAS